jgi:CheY-like chemotaxis protein
MHSATPFARPVAACVSQPPDPQIRLKTLREEGYDVIHASTGKEALAWCMRQAADVLVTT